MKIPLLLISLYATCIYAAEPMNTVLELFHNLGPSEVARVKYTSTGCFNADVYQLDFHSAEKYPMGVEVTEIRMNWGQDGKGMRETGRVLLGSIPLS